MSEKVRQQIEANIASGGIDEANRAITFTAATSNAVWVYSELIRMVNVDGMDLSWVNTGNAPLLSDHDMKKPLGHLKSARVEQQGSDKVIRVEAEFFPEGVSDYVDERWRMVQSGMMRNVSIGLQPKTDGIKASSTRVEVDGDMKDVGVEYVESALMDEVSIVTIPADKNAMIQSKVDDGLARIVQQVVSGIAHQSEASDGEVPMSDEIKNSGETEDKPEVQAKPADASETVEQSKQPEHIEQAKSFDPTGQRFLAKNEARLKQMGVDETGIDKLRQFVDTDAGVSEQAVQAHIAQSLMQVDQQGAGRIDNSGKAPAAHTADHKFNLGRLVQKVVRGEGHNLDGMEGEMIQQSLTDMRTAGVDLPDDYNVGNPHAMYIPHAAIMADEVAREDSIDNALLHGDMKLQAKTNRVQQMAESRMTQAVSVGATPNRFWNEVFDERWFVEALVSEAKLLQKITVLPGELYQDLVGVTETGSWNVTHHDENGARNESQGLTWGNRKLQWHALTARQDYSQRTLDQSQMFFARLLATLRRDMTRAQNQALINGESAQHDPIGILNYSGLSLVSNGANGGALNWEAITRMRERFYTANADTTGGMRCWAMTPGIMEQLNRTPRFTNSQGDAGDSIIQMAPGGAMVIGGEEVIVENNLPQDGTKGTGRNLHSMIYGNFAEVEMGMFSGMMLLVDPYTEASTSQTRLFLSQAYDFSPRHVASFVAATDVNPA